MKILSNKKYRELLLKSCKGMFGAVTDDMLLRSNAFLTKEKEQLQQELQRKDNIINGIKSYVEIGISANFNMNNGDYQEGLYSAFCKVLDKINELEEKK